MRKVRPILDISAAVCAAAALGLITAIVVTEHFDASKTGLERSMKHGFALTQHFHVCFSDAGVWFYSESVPYRGGLIAFFDSQGNYYYADGGRGRSLRLKSRRVGSFGQVLKEFTGEDGRVVRREYARDLPGVYYRRFQWVGRRPQWTLWLSCVYPLLLFSVLPMVWCFHWWRQRRSRQHASGPPSSKHPAS